MQFGQFGKINPAQSSELDQWAKAITVSQSEMMRLSSRRVRAYVELPKTMAKCRTPVDFAQQQQAFWQQCAEDYATAAQVLTSNWTQFLPFASAITGLDATLNDESLKSAPGGSRPRDVMPVNAAEPSSARAGRDEVAAERSRDPASSDKGRVAA